MDNVKPFNWNGLDNDSMSPLVSEEPSFGVILRILNSNFIPRIVMVTVSPALSRP